MKNSNIILYSFGAYGHFIHWCCEYLSGNLDSSVVPLNELGNCHNHTHRYEFYYPDNFKKYTESNENYQFIGLHEDSFDLDDNTNMFLGNMLDVLDKNLSYLQNNYKHSIYIYPTATSKVWITNNQIYKIRLSDWCGVGNEEKLINWLKSQNASNQVISALSSYGVDRIKQMISCQSGMIDNFNGWGHQSIDEFANWELRELASSYFFDRMSAKDLLDSIIESELQYKFPNIKFIKLDNFRTDFKNTIFDILDFYQLPIVNKDKIDEIHSTWKSKQFYIDSDSQVHQIVTAILNNSELDWSSWNITFIDELCIQRLLFDNGINIKCWNLNTFPTNTKDFIPLLEPL